MQTLLICAVLLLITDTRSAPAPFPGSDEDSSEEMVVPRHPKIAGDKTEHIELSLDEKPDNLVCEIQGTPTPHAIWLKDGKELTTMFESDYNRESGTCTLTLVFKENTPTNQLPGNYTCVAANFLGQTSKSFIVMIDILPLVKSDKQ